MAVEQRNKLSFQFPIDLSKTLPTKQPARAY